MEFGLGHAASGCSQMSRLSSSTCWPNERVKATEGRACFQVEVWVGVASCSRSGAALGALPSGVMSRRPSGKLAGRWGGREAAGESTVATSHRPVGWGLEAYPK
jgi:hypothetical protein